MEQGDIEMNEKDLIKFFAWDKGWAIAWLIVMSAGILSYGITMLIVYIVEF